MMEERHLKAASSKDHVSNSFEVNCDKATGSTGTTRKSNPEADLPRPIRVLNLSSTRASTV